MLPALRELHIDIPIWNDHGEAESAFGDRLRELRASNVPSLHHLRIDLEKEGSCKHRRRRPFTSWIEIESAVNVARKTLFSDGAQAEIELSEAEVWNQDGRTFGVRRRYISKGVYERMDMA